MKRRRPFLQILCTVLCIQLSLCTDMKSEFGSRTDVMPAAFGDYNSDELTDLFVIGNDSKYVEILLASTVKEPYFQSEGLRCNHTNTVTSVAPGDFDGDALMDVLVTTRPSDNPNITEVFIHWGANHSLKCTSEALLQTLDEPLVIDYQTNLIADLFGIEYSTGNRTIWSFNRNRTINVKYLAKPLTKLRIPHSNAFLDLNEDNSPDLFLTGEDTFEILLWNKRTETFEPSADTIEYPKKQSSTEKVARVGQTLFMDLETNDQMYPIMPVCYDKDCTESFICVYANKKWNYLNVNLNQSTDKKWGFTSEGEQHRYTDTITLRAGDFNNDGFVDMLVTLQLKKGEPLMRTFLFENVPCEALCNDLTRTFKVDWDAFKLERDPSRHANENAVMGVFYDFMQDGILDAIFVQQSAKGYKVTASRNSLDYDANFIKVMVMSGITNVTAHEQTQSLLGTKKIFSSNLPGPKVQYRTTNQDGNTQAGRASQLPQSAHFAMYLPYTIFGLGRTSNFIEVLYIKMFNHTKELNQIIPNSQLIVIIPDNNAMNPSKWIAQIYVQPSKIILQTVGALACTCLVIAIIIGVLHWKERREDRIERLQEAHRFHFDAM